MSRGHIPQLTQSIVHSPDECGLDHQLIGPQHELQGFIEQLIEPRGDGHTSGVLWEGGEPLLHQPRDI